MNRGWQFLNFLGVAVLAVICAVQWRRDGLLNQDVNRLEKTRLEQTAKIAEQEKTARGLADDLAGFKEQLTRVQRESEENRKKLQETERENHLLTDAREQLQASITNWEAAVTLRDDRLKTANERITEFADRLNASIGKYNELASNYNVVVKDLNETRLAQAQAQAHAATNTPAK